MTFRLTIRRPGRAATVVGAVVAVGATTMMALAAGPASADEPGRCVENVNVRAEPNTTSRIVALCEAGTEVQVGESRDGFVRLTDLGGWSAAEFISVAGAAPGTRPAPLPSTTPIPSTTLIPRATPGPGAGSVTTQDTTQDATTARPRPNPGSASGAERNGSTRSTARTAPTTVSPAPRPTTAPPAGPLPAPLPALPAPLGGLLG